MSTSFNRSIRDINGDLAEVAALAGDSVGAYVKPVAGEPAIVTLTPQSARKLAKALRKAADVAENAPAGPPPPPPLVKGDHVNIIPGSRCITRGEDTNAGVVVEAISPELVEVRMNDGTRWFLDPRPGVDLVRTES